ncbi:MAG: helix-hairpin-helix domain-containing protein [Chitinophagaceae bacterium]
MKPALLLTLLLLWARALFTQEVAETLQQQLESQATDNEIETEDDSYWQQLDYLKKHPLNLNTATKGQLEELHLLSPLQISHFLNYRSLLGNLVSIYELQAVPTLDIATIRKLLPFVTINDGGGSIAGLWKRFGKGQASVLTRFGSLLEKPAEYDKKDSGVGYYTGSRARLLFRYRYNYQNLLQYGVLGDKDAGEQLFKGQQRTGFDFYSAHLFIRKLGIVKALAIGDFTVNMGQGLIQWQSLAFGKTAIVTDIKRQGPVLRPYTSAGEFNFHRGIGVTIGKRNWEATIFASYRKLSATLITDSINDNKVYVSTLLTSGYHRTLSELARKNNLQSLVAGSNVRLWGANGNVGLNVIQYQFRYPLQPSENLYDKFSVNGKRWSNYSFDYSYTFYNVHMFGEIAADQQFKTAAVAGLLASVDPRVDIAMVYRNINKAYQSLYGNAFTENSMPVNENGMYMGVVVRPFSYWQLNAYADLFSFPWLKYRVNAPATGGDYFIQLSCTPSKRVTWYGRYHYEVKPVNSDENQPVRGITEACKQSWRTQFSFIIDNHWQLRHRVELVNYKTGNTITTTQNGFLTYLDCNYSSSRLFTGLRLSYFDTDGYDSRIYAFEQDVPYSYYIPAFYGKGLKCYLNVGFNTTSVINRYTNNSCSSKLNFKLARFFSNNEMQYGSGLENTEGNNRTEFNLQFLLFIR